ncbi:molybdopterin-dependent oxidoreductase [Limisalsivibrio acetivorans]|uniref:molybdopterin-dependent oxidoreductase n=1 Tax=Limisalsivibrio acetivorans TaxID=1304888 RepID=UPI0003B65F19|nr:molybdopterin-dependent oxidoreductase [Limisalsivibrio acetivorans]
MDRRRFLKRAGLFGAKLFIISTPFLSLPLFRNTAAAELRLSVKNWYIRTVEFITPSINTVEFRLDVTGMAEKPYELKYDDLEKLQDAEYVRDFNCVEGWTVPDVKWSGIKLSTLMKKATPNADARFVNIYCSGGKYTESITIEEAMDDENILATHIEGHPLEVKHGFPARIFMPKKYGYKSPKWVVRMELSDERITGFWPERGYDIDGDYI